MRTSSLELRPGGSHVGETGGQWPVSWSPSAKSGTLVIRCGRRLQWKVAEPPKGGVAALPTTSAGGDFGDNGL